MKEKLQTLINELEIRSNEISDQYTEWFQMSEVELSETRTIDNIVHELKKIVDDVV